MQKLLTFGLLLSVAYGYASDAMNSKLIETTEVEFNNIKAAAAFRGVTLNETCSPSVLLSDLSKICKGYRCLEIGSVKKKEVYGWFGGNRTRCVQDDRYAPYKITLQNGQGDEFELDILTEWGSAKKKAIDDALYE